MIKHFCDMCSKQINMNVDGVSVMFNAQGIAIRNSVNEDLHLCLDCNQKLKVFIHNSAENKN